LLDRGVLLAAALAVSGSHAAALPVRVVLDWPSGRPASAHARARIEAVRTAGPTGGGRVEAETGWDGGRLDLGEGIWQLQASVPGYWSQGAQVAVGREEPADARLALWPAATLHGTVATTGGDPLPRDLAIRLSAIPAGETPAPTVSAPETSPSRAELRCRIEEGAWSCQGPAGLFDLQIESPGYAPRYAWEVRLGTTASSDLGRIDLRRAASVFGHAVRRGGSQPEGPCRATLRADATRRGAQEPDPADPPEGEGGRSVSLSRRGYFQLVGVPPGAHVLEVECPTASAVWELRVPAEGETRVELPLEELTLDVVVAPKVDPEGRGWRVALDRTAPRFRTIEENGTVSAAGRWTRRGLTAGSYRVALVGSDGTQRLERFFDLDARSGPLSLRLGLTAVAGRALLGTRPLGGRLVFINEAGGEQVTLTSDDDGRFQGLLPVAPGVEETRWTVEAHPAQPPVHRRLQGVSVPSVAGEAAAWLELALPMGGVHGTVVSEGRAPQGGAQVTFEDASGARTVVTADDAGSFDLLELPPGSYTAVAESAAGVSERTPFEVVEGSSAELELVLDPLERVVFHVVADQGPVADATVQVWLPPGVPRFFTRTDAEGRFEADLPPGTTEVGLTVGAAGHALRLTRLRVSNEQTVNLDASGGTLVLDLERPGRTVDGSATPYLVHDGAIEAAGALAGWGAADAGDPVKSVVESLEPGVYALCLAGPAELEALWRGALPSDRCRTGSVEPGRTLTLSLP
jgi:hypothetical protein